LPSVKFGLKFTHLYVAYGYILNCIVIILFDGVRPFRAVESKAVNQLF